MGKAHVVMLLVICFILLLLYYSARTGVVEYFYGFDNRDKRFLSHAVYTNCNRFEIQVLQDD